MENKKRLDLLLVELEFVQTRSKAAQLIKEGKVFVNGEKALKSSMKTNPESLEVRGEIDFVSRGAYKLQGAFDRWKLNFSGKIIADIGASTGGFTDFALKNGAEKVFAIDVGKDQLDPSIKSSPRVQNMEGVNIRYGVSLGEPVDFVVVDLSFISLQLVLTPVLSLLKKTGEGVFLIKPQFEVGKGNIGKNGLVKDPAMHVECLERLFDVFSLECDVIDVMGSPIFGGDGNREFLFYIKLDKSCTKRKINRSELRKL